MISQHSIVTLDELQDLTGLSISEIANSNLPTINRRGGREGFLAHELKFWWFDHILTNKLGIDFRMRLPDIDWPLASDQFFRKLARARRRVNKLNRDVQR